MIEHHGLWLVAEATEAPVEEVEMAPLETPSETPQTPTSSPLSTPQNSKETRQGEVD